MSFSSDVKTELLKVMPGKKHCAESELAALIPANTKNDAVAKKVFTIQKKFYNINDGVFKTELPDKSCCRFAYLRGMFIAYGTVNDPNKSYHMEFNVPDEETAERLIGAFKDLEAVPSVMKRGTGYSVYIKDSSVISDVLAAMGAGVSMMNFENARVVKETRGQVNRRVNCELGNLKKTADAGARQIECIKIIEEKMGIDALPEELRETARLRLENPEASLGELGEMFDPPLGRSGVNHRLQKLISIAEGI